MTGKVANTPKHNIRNEYASWLATPQRLRVSLNLPTNKTAFAEMKGVNVKTLTRWEKSPGFSDIVEQRKNEALNNVTNSSVAAIGPPRPVTHGTALKNLRKLEPATITDDPVWEEELSPDEFRYRQVKDTLVKMAMDGSQQAIDLYLKHYGKPFIAAEQSDSSMFENMSDEELLREVVRLAGIERISEVVAEVALPG
jgi:hypothetical protein